MLANISGLPLLARSINSGDSLEKHWLCASVLAACAAGEPSLFTLLLSTGRLAPLAGYVTKENLASLEALEKSTGVALNLGNLKTAECVSFQADRAFLLADLHDEGVYLSGPKALVAFVGEVSKRLEMMKRTAAVDGGGRTSTRIAAIRSSAKLGFADTLLFFDDTLFLCQMKHTCRADMEETTLGEELEKMGGGRDAKSPGSVCVRGLKAAWKKATGITINSVVFCFVTTRKHSFDVGGNLVDSVPKDYCSSKITCKFLTVGSASFLPFDGTCLASQSIYHELVRELYVPRDETTLKD